MLQPFSAGLGFEKPPINGDDSNKTSAMGFISNTLGFRNSCRSYACIHVYD
jgi:hypothetical protein